MNPYYAIAALSISFSFGWLVHGWKVGAEETAKVEAQIAAKQELQDIADNLGKKLDKSLSNIKIEYRTINNEIQRETIRERVYTECVHSDTAFGMLQRALSGGKSTSQLDGGMPAVDAAGEQ